MWNQNVIRVLPWNYPISRQGIVVFHEEKSPYWRYIGLFFISIKNWSYSYNTFVCASFRMVVKNQLARGKVDFFFALIGFSPTKGTNWKIKQHNYIEWDRSENKPKVKQSEGFAGEAFCHLKPCEHLELNLRWEYSAGISFISCNYKSIIFSNPQFLGLVRYRDLKSSDFSLVSWDSQYVFFSF